MTRFFTSDLHFSDSNQLRYGRPWATTSQMNRGLIARWNQVVTPDDYVVFIGDWCVHPSAYISMKELNFKHLFFIRGNHDDVNQLGYMIATNPAMQHLADRVSIHDHLIVEIGGKDYYAVHRPIQVCDSMPSLVGHVHNRWKFLDPGVEIGEHSRHKDGVTKVLSQPILNVGCDQHDYFPISDQQIQEMFDDYERKRAAVRSFDPKRSGA